MPIGLLEVTTNGVPIKNVIMNSFSELAFPNYWYLPVDIILGQTNAVVMLGKLNWNGKWWVNNCIHLQVVQPRTVWFLVARPYNHLQASCSIPPPISRQQISPVNEHQKNESGKQSNKGRRNTTYNVCSIYYFRVRKENNNTLRNSVMIAGPTYLGWWVSGLETNLVVERFPGRVISRGQSKLTNARNKVVIDT